MGNPPGLFAGRPERRAGRGLCGQLNSAAAGHGFIARAGRRNPCRFPAVMAFRGSPPPLGLVRPRRIRSGARPPLPERGNLVPFSGR